MPLSEWTKPKQIIDFIHIGIFTIFEIQELGTNHKSQTIEEGKLNLLKSSCQQLVSHMKQKC